MPHGEKGGGEDEGERRGADGMELPGRYIGGIFQIYYPLICYIGGGREREEERGRAPLFLCGTLLREVRRLVHSYGEQWPFYSLTHDFFALVFVPTLVKAEGQMRDFQNSSSARRPLS